MFQRVLNALPGHIVNHRLLDTEPCYDLRGGTVHVLLKDEGSRINAILRWATSLKSNGFAVAPVADTYSIMTTGYVHDIRVQVKVHTRAPETQNLRDMAVVGVLDRSQLVKFMHIPEGAL